MTTLSPAAPDYTDRDFASMNRRLEHLLAAVFTVWTDYNRSNFGNVIKEALAFVGDVFGYYQDQQARETRWGTATQRASMIALSRLINYTLDGATAASTSLDFTIVRRVSPGGTVTFPAGTFCKTEDVIDPKRFQLLSDLVIASGGTTGSATVEHSETQQDLYSAVGEEGEEFELTQTPFLDGSESMTIDSLSWTQVDNFLDSGTTDRHYVLLVDQNDRATIRAGDGTNGAIPPVGGAVQVDYKTGGGEDGNVESGTIVKFEPGTWTDEYGNTVTVSVTNASAASGGADRETVAQARERAPRSLRVLNRAVARTDFEDLALQIQSVARALMLTSNEDTTVPEGWGWLYVVPVGGGNPSSALITEIEDFINDDYPPPLTFEWEVRSVTAYKTVNVDATVYLSQDATEAAVTTAIREALQDFFAPQNDDGTTNVDIDFGYYYKATDGTPDPKLPLSTIYNLIHDTVGIRRLGTPADGEGLELNGAEDDVDLLVREFPEAGTLRLVNGDTATEFYNGPID